MSVITLALLIAPSYPTSDLSQSLPFVMPADFEDLQAVAWRVEQGEPDPANPLLVPEMPWDAGGVFSHGTVLRDPLDGIWKAWQVSTPVSKPQGPGTWTHDRRLTYLESPDGVNWRRPSLSLVRWDGHEQTNILLDLFDAMQDLSI